MSFIVIVKPYLYKIKCWKRDKTKTGEFIQAIFCFKPWNNRNTIKRKKHKPPKGKKTRYIILLLFHTKSDLQFLETDSR